MRRYLRLALVAYLVVLGVGVFGPEPGEELDRAAARLRRLEQEVRERVDRTTTTAVPSSPADPAGDVPSPAPSPAEDPWFDELRAEPFFNVVVFVPIGLLVPLCFPQVRWLTVLLGAQLSGTIELVQDLVLDHRSPTVEDVRWNSLGTAIGFGVWLLLRLVVPGLVRRASAGAERT